MKSLAPRESKEVALDGTRVVCSAGVEGLGVGAEGPDDGVKALGVGVEGPNDRVEDPSVGVEDPGAMTVGAR
jgi:hypothetical protein